MIVQRFGMIGVFATLVASAVCAEAPSISLLPTPRPSGADQAVQEAMAALAAPIRSSDEMRPPPWPGYAQEPARLVLATSGAAVRSSLLPEARPKDLRITPLVRTSTVRVPVQDPIPTTRHGSVCGDRSIRGTAISPIAGRLKGCGVANAVRVTSVDGVALSVPATINCETARALKSWVSNSVKPVVGNRGGGVASLRVVAHYSCRTINSQPGARISEHGKGNAIDIAAINLRDGSALTLLTGWRDRVQGPLLKAMHRGACGPFGTVLGPDSDRYHQDHFHFDVAKRRSGAYCR